MPFGLTLKDRRCNKRSHLCSSSVVTTVICMCYSASAVRVKRSGSRHRAVAQGSGTGQWHRAVAQGSGTGQWHRAVAQDSGTGQWHRAVAQGSGTGQWHRAVAQDLSLIHI